MMVTKKIKRLKPQLIDSDTQLNSQIFNDRMDRQEHLRLRSGLKSSPSPVAEEDILVRGFATVLQQSSEDILIQHPLYPFQVIVNKTVGASHGYLISCGDYYQQNLDMIHHYITTGDNVLDIGAGFGLSTIQAAIASSHSVTALEPNKKIVPILLKNSHINGVDIQIIEACVTPENSANLTDFYIQKEGADASLFKDDTDNIETTIKIQSIPLPELLIKTKANALIINAVGAEVGLFYHVDLKKINKIILTINTPMIGEKSTANIISYLIEQGFSLTDIKGLVFAFVR